MRFLLLTLTTLILSAGPAGVPTAKVDEKPLELQLKDMARLKGVRANQLLGYGVVVGLDGTGDKDQTTFTVQSLTNLMARQGITVDPKSVKVKNVAAVMVTAEFPPFVKTGQRIDVSVNSTGDAKSLAGGMLLMTPLVGPDNLTYAVAQGPLLVGGFSASAGGNTATKNHPTAGRIPDGALVEREIPNTFNDKAVLQYSLQDEDFTTATRVMHAINKELGTRAAKTLDGRSVEVAVPKEFQGRAVELAARLESVSVQIQPKNRVVINEKTGTVIMGSDVKIGAVSIVQGGLSIMVSSTPVISQPLPLSDGKTVNEKKQDVTLAEEKAKTLNVGAGASVGRLVEMLNAMGVTSRDVIAILQAIKDAGAMNAELRIL